MTQMDEPKFNFICTILTLSLIDASERIKCRGNATGVGGEGHEKGNIDCKRRSAACRV